MSATADVLKPAWSRREKILAGTAAAASVLFLCIALMPSYNMPLMQAKEAAQRQNAMLTDMAHYSVFPAAAPVHTASREQKSAAGAPALADRKMIQTSVMDLIVTNPAETAEKIRVLAESLGGYLETSQIAGTREAPSATLTIRVPATGLNQARSALRQLAVRIESERSDATDVTKQYVDMEARLRNLHAQEAQYLVILKQATSVEDLLNVSGRLSEVRGQIEQEQAEFNSLSHQVETVALAITLRAEADTQVFGLQWRPLYRLKIAARDGFNSLADYAATMTSILFQLPAVLAWLITVLLAGIGVWRLFRWTARKFFGWSGSGPLVEKTAN
jgi:chemotaxis protein histidine kinase CheA